MPPRKSEKSAPSPSVAAKLAALRAKNAELRAGSLSETLVEDVTAFSTGNLSLDYATGVGGFPRGRVIELYGPPKSGKTTSALQAAAIHQRRVQAGEDKGAVIYLDYERSLDLNYCRALGIDVDDEETFVCMYPDSLEHGINFFREFLAEGLVAMCVCDSVAAMVSEKELAALTGAPTVADRAKALQQVMRQVTGPLSKQRCSMIMLNHVMDKIDLSFMGQQMAARGVKIKTTPGGTALLFYSSMRIEFTQVDQHKGKVVNLITQEAEEIVTATTVEAKVVKNKVAVPHRVARMRVRFGLGFSQAYSVLQVLMSAGIVKKDSAWFKVKADHSPTGKDWQVQGENAILTALEADQEWMGRMEQVAQDILQARMAEDIDPETGEVTVPEMEEVSQ